MLPEISLNLLDIAQNSVKAGAGCITLTVEVNLPADRLIARVEDDGCGMDEETIKRVVDPFYTTRTTRKVGLGIPFFKQAAEITGGSFRLESAVGKGTLIESTFVYSSIDRMPLGDMTGTITSLVQCNPHLRFRYVYLYNGQEFVFDTNDIREVLGDLPLDLPEVMQFIKEYINENTQSLEKG